MISEEMKEAAYWETFKEKMVRCNLCPHRCIIPEGKSGICGVRWNKGGKLYTEIYGQVTALSMDPIEKKPLFHFYPGRDILSVSSYGCNFRCLHCQNWELSQEYRKLIKPFYLSPEDLTHEAKARKNNIGVAFTYNEPTIWFEYLRDAFPLLKKEGVKTVLVTNGYLNPEPLKELLPNLSAANVDVKGFNDDFYHKIVGGKLEPVLETVKLMHSQGVHVELTYLVIPTLNDDDKQVKDFINWVLENVGERTPVHITRFHPDYKLSHLSPTPMETLEKIYSTAMEMGLKYVFLGNVPPGRYETTYCPSCGKPVIKREYFWIKGYDLIKGRCKYCREEILKYY